MFELSPIQVDNRVFCMTLNNICLAQYGIFRAKLYINMKITRNM